MQTKFRSLLLLGMLALGAVTAGAEETAQLIEQLDGPEFAQRQEASRKLSEAGKAVFPELEKAAESGTREVVTRAIDILKKHFEGGDDETKQAAKAALERLTKSSNQSAAQRATQALTPPQEAPQPGINGIFGGGIRVNGGAIQIQVVANGGNGAANRKVQIREANGKREVEVEEGDHKVKLQTFPNGGIEIEITDKVNGKDVTKKVEAKDLDDLKKKDPAAAKEYEKYNQGGGNIQINGIRIQGGAIPVPAAPAIPQANRDQIIKSLEQSIERVKAQLPQNPNLQRIIDSLEQQKKRLEEEPKK